MLDVQSAFFTVSRTCQNMLLEMLATHRLRGVRSCLMGTTTFTSPIELHQAALLRDLFTHQTCVRLVSATDCLNSDRALLLASAELI